MDRRAGILSERAAQIRDYDRHAVVAYRASPPDLPQNRSLAHDLAAAAAQQFQGQRGSILQPLGTSGLCKDRTLDVEAPVA